MSAPKCSRQPKIIRPERPPNVGKSSLIAAGITLFAILTAKFIVLELVAIRMNKIIPLSKLDSRAAADYFFSPMGSIIILVGVFAAFRAASGTSRR
jgi:hypothetical protein